MAVILLFILERIFPLRKKHRPLRHLGYNGILTIMLLLTAFLFVRPAVNGAFSWIESQTFGMLRWFSLPVWLEFIVAFLFLDLSFYYWHRLNHRIHFLWRFHNVHHIDPELDVSTAFRFHFGEVALSSGFRFVQVMVIGPPLIAFLVYEIVFQVGTFFHHSNLRLPVRFEYYLNLFVVTPRMHTIHHSQVKGETNSNYSVVFRIWDTIHRTICLSPSVEKVKIGVPAYPENDNRLGYILSLPFRRQRKYWSSEG